jgi:uncharacterized protein (TIGR02284 family)
MIHVHKGNGVVPLHPYGFEQMNDLLSQIAMEHNKRKVINLLNDLVKVNNDRILGYEKAADAIHNIYEVDIKTLFFKMAEESRYYRTKLSEALQQLHGDVPNDTSAAGDIFRVWIGMKAAITGNNVLSTLECCEFGENHALKAYRHALQPDDILWPQGLKEILENQYNLLRLSRDKMRRTREDYASHVMVGVRS